jgi:hypothetical protein
MHVHSFKTMNKGIQYTIYIFILGAAIAVIVAAVLPSLWNGLLTSLPYPIGGSGDPNGPTHHGILGRLQTYGLYGTPNRDTAWLIIAIVAAVIVAIDIYGIFMAKKWARLLAILISIPLWAILLGFGTMWYLLTQPSGKKYFGISVAPKPEE